MGPNLDLTPVEKRLKELLLAVAASENEPSSSADDLQTELGNQMVLRFTGGWVRDKLLGVSSHDIDVAISNMTGYQYCTKLKQMLEDPKMAKRFINGSSKGAGNQAKDLTIHKSMMGNLHKIEANPEKSKHLETVTTNIMGLDIDFVNLRKETYTNSSRIPQMEFGTPEEDALRRDATINALFYNLHTSLVEDLTGRGLGDMKAQIIRTPLEPYQTFEDDPLRVLRLIRFASRLNYKIDPAAKVAMANPNIQEALRNKISRERIGTELEKMLKGNNPVIALTLIDQLGLYNTIYTDSGSLHDTNPSTEHWSDGYELLNELVKVSDGPGDSPQETLRKLLLRDSAEAYLAWVLVSLLPWGPLGTQPEAYSGSKAHISPPVRVAKEGIKATSKTAEVISSSFQNAREISSLCKDAGKRSEKSHPSSYSPNTSDRAVLGLKVRRWGSSWRSQFMLSLLLDVAGLFNEVDSKKDTEIILRDYATFVKRIESYGLLEAYLFKPVLDGKTLMKRFSLKPGPGMKVILDAIIEWQLASPENCKMEDALAMVISRKDEFGIS